jgi:hypothetical protein
MAERAIAGCQYARRKTPDSVGLLMRPTPAGIVFEGTAVAMVVPGGPAFKPSKDGKRIEKGDVLQKVCIVVARGGSVGG